jgi:hypothetical protein
MENNHMPTNEINLDGLSRDELAGLLGEIMVRLREGDAEEIKSNFVTKSQRVRLEQMVENHLMQNPKP